MNQSLLRRLSAVLVVAVLLSTPAWAGNGARLDPSPGLFAAVWQLLSSLFTGTTAASYLKNVGDFELAEAALAEALQLARKIGDPHEQGRLLFQMGEVTGQIHPERGIAYVRKALVLIDGRREPRLELCALHNLAVFLCETRRLQPCLRPQLTTCGCGCRFAPSPFDYRVMPT